MDMRLIKTASFRLIIFVLNVHSHCQKDKPAFPARCEKCQFFLCCHCALQYLAFAVTSSLKCVQPAEAQAWTLWPFTSLSVSSASVMKRAGYKWISPDFSYTLSPALGCGGQRFTAVYRPAIHNQSYSYHSTLAVASGYTGRFQSSSTNLKKTNKLKLQFKFRKYIYMLY